jgi:hypothetical protein
MKDIRKHLKTMLFLRRLRPGTDKQDKMIWLKLHQLRTLSPGLHEILSLYGQNGIKWILVIRTGLQIENLISGITK